MGPPSKVGKTTLRIYKKIKQIHYVIKLLHFCDTFLLQFYAGYFRMTLF